MEVYAAFMSEFKFACPKCGQHITADSSTSGTEIECPTCFSALVVPQAPVSGSSSLILSAALVNKNRRTEPVSGRRKKRPLGFPGFVRAFLVLLLLAGGAIALFSMRDTLRVWLQKLHF